MYTIRLFQESDSSQMLEIYKPFVTESSITFDYKLPDLEGFQTKLNEQSIQYPCLVCLSGEKIIGYAYASLHRYKKAYQWSVESTIYLSSDHQGKGIGYILYDSLIAILNLQGYFNVFAGVTVPNIGSEQLHLKSGFVEIGLFKKIGYKQAAWHDVKWFQLKIRPYEPDPPEPRALAEIINSERFKKILFLMNTKLIHI